MGYTNNNSNLFIYLFIYYVILYFCLGRLSEKTREKLHGLIPEEKKTNKKCPSD